MQAFGDIERRVIAAQHRRLLQQGACPVGHMIVIDRGGGDQRLVAIADSIRIELRVGIQRERVGRLRERNQMFGPRAECEDTKLFQAAFALGAHGMVHEEVHVFAHDLRVMGYELRPIVRGCGRGGDDPKVLGVFVRAEEEPVAVVVGVITVIRLARVQHAPVGFGRVGRQGTHFGGLGAGRCQEEIGFAAGTPGIDTKQLVGFFVDQRVVGAAQAMAVQAVGTLGGVFDRVKERPVVGGPDNRDRLLDFVRQRLAGPQVFDLQRILPEARDISRVSQ